jgi:RimJ/RimL family protein N-acetyltransferase
VVKFTFAYAFGILNLRRIALEVYLYNEITANAYEQARFKREGIQR